MTNTKYVEVEFGHIAHFEIKREVLQSTQWVAQGRVETVKMTKQEGENTFSGFKRVNYSEQKMKEAYRKINKMLGGN